MLGSLLSALVLLGAGVHSWQQSDQWQSLEDQKDNKYVRLAEGGDNQSYCTWKCLTFTLQWPGSFCQSLDEGLKCQLPADTSSWTIHGLWPQRVFNCCRCWHLFPSDLQVLSEELSKEWPSFLKSKSSFQFWRMEWVKHGVCAACVEGLNSPLQYFTLCLKLRQQYNITRALSEAGVVPSCERPYKLAELREALSPVLGANYEVQCVTDLQKRELWFQVKIPLSRNLNLGCSPGLQDGPGRNPFHGHPCDPQTPIYLVPIEPQHPSEPCG